MSETRVESILSYNTLGILAYGNLGVLLFTGRWCSSYGVPKTSYLPRVYRHSHVQGRSDRILFNEYIGNNSLGTCLAISLGFKSRSVTCAHMCLTGVGQELSKVLTSRKPFCSYSSQTCRELFYNFFRFLSWFLGRHIYHHAYSSKTLTRPSSGNSRRLPTIGTDSFDYHWDTE